MTSRLTRSSRRAGPSPRSRCSRGLRDGVSWVGGMESRRGTCGTRSTL